MKISDFTNISLFSKILTVELFGNLVRNKFYCTRYEVPWDLRKMTVDILRPDCGRFEETRF